MITRQDLEEAIAECHGQRNPNASTCLKLAAFYTIKKELFGEEKEAERLYSYSPPPEKAEQYGDSDFLMAVSEKNTADIMRIMDELMNSMQILQPRIYDSVMRKIQSL